MTSKKNIRILPAEKDLAVSNWDDYATLDALHYGDAFSVNDEEFAFVYNTANFIVGIQIRRGFNMSVEKTDPSPTITDCLPSDAPLDTTWEQLFTDALKADNTSMTLEQRYHALCKMDKRIYGYLSAWWKEHVKKRIDAETLQIERKREEVPPPKKSTDSPKGKDQVGQSQKLPSLSKEKEVDAPKEKKSEPVKAIDPLSKNDAPVSSKKRAADPERETSAESFKKARVEYEAKCIVSFLKTPESSRVELSSAERTFFNKLMAVVPAEKALDEYDLLKAGYSPTSSDMKTRIDFIRQCISLYS